MKKRSTVPPIPTADCPACHSRMPRTDLDAHKQHCPRFLAIAARTSQKPTSKPQQYSKVKPQPSIQGGKSQAVQKSSDAKGLTLPHRQTLGLSGAAPRDSHPKIPQSSGKKVAAKSSFSSSHEAKRTERLTKDGYLIDECWQCKRRICLIPSKDDYRVYDINLLGRSGGPHLCDGQDGSLDSLDRADSFSSQRAIVAIKKRFKGGLKKR